MCETFVMDEFCITEEPSAGKTITNVDITIIIVIF